MVCKTVAEYLHFGRDVTSGRGVAVRPSGALSRQRRCTTLWKVVHFLRLVRLHY